MTRREGDEGGEGERKTRLVKKEEEKVQICMALFFFYFL